MKISNIHEAKSQPSKLIESAIPSHVEKLVISNPTQKEHYALTDTL